MRKYLLSATALAALLALALASNALGVREVVHAGNLVVVDDGGISPSVLPKHGGAPIDARIEVEIGTDDGTHPPALQKVSANIDKTIQLDVRGIPTCKLGQLLSRSTKDAKKACPDAIVGSGEGEVEVEFAEQPAFSAKGPLVLFNGGVRNGVITVYVHAYVAVPAPTAIVATAKVSRIHRGRYGLHMETTVPKIAGGAGSATSFTVHIGRRFTYKGQKRSFLTASCPTGHWGTEGEIAFSNGDKLNVAHIFPCTGKG
jgi:hypothetical protein